MTTLSPNVASCKERMSTVVPQARSARVLLFAGQLAFDDLQEILRGLSQVEIVGVLVHERRISSGWDANRTGLPTWTRRELMNVEANVEQTPLHDRYEEILASILADPRSYYLMERLYGIGGCKSVFNNTLRIEKLVWKSIALVFKLRPQRMISTNTPHDITWFVARVGEMLGVDFYLTATSPLPWRTWVVKGLDEQKPVELKSCFSSSVSGSDAVSSFIEKGRSSYVSAMPEIERKRLEKYRGAFFSPSLELRWIFSSKSPRTVMRRVHSALQKRSLLKLYSELARSFREPEKYVVFFLHYQPERTTLPDGYRYVQQWLAIRALSQALPVGWHLVVKEHPTTFRHMLDPSVRDPQFYESIASLSNAYLAPMPTSSFDLIDKSQAIATVMGTVGVESLLRGKPVLAFGAAQYRGAKGVFAIGSAEDVNAAMIQLQKGNVMPSDRELLDYFSWVERNSFDRQMRINGSLEALRIAVQDLS